MDNWKKIYWILWAEWDPQSFHSKPISTFIPEKKIIYARWQRTPRKINETWIILQNHIKWQTVSSLCFIQIYLINKRGWSWTGKISDWIEIK
jgi:hypothetical protein